MSTTAVQPGTYTARELCKLLRISRRHLTDCVREDRIPGAFRVGAALRFSRAAVNAWMNGPAVKPSTN